MFSNSLHNVEIADDVMNDKIKITVYDVLFINYNIFYIIIYE
jgi:hypothetical protein